LRVRVAAPPVEVLDTIGAGDAFGAGILAWLHDHHLIGASLVLSRDQLRSALDYACLVASLTVARAGADPPWKRELIPAYRRALAPPARSARASTPSSQDKDA